MYCPHDLSANTEFRDDLPTLIGGNITENNTQNIISKLKAKGPTIKAFHVVPPTNEDKTFKIARIKFISPYARYLAVLPFSEKQRQEDLAKAAEENRKRKLCPDSAFAPEVSVVS